MIVNKGEIMIIEKLGAFIFFMMAMISLLAAKNLTM